MGDTGSAESAKGNLWYLSISSWAGTVAGASHHVPTLFGPRKRISVLWCMTADEAEEKNRLERDTWYREGMEEGRFNREADAIRAGITVWERMADPEKDILIRGQKGELGEAIAGPQGHVEALTSMARKIEAIPDCGRGVLYDPQLDREMGAACREYTDYLREHFERFPSASIFGKGADKDPDREVGSEEVAWGTPQPDPEVDYSIPLIVPPGI